MLNAPNKSIAAGRIAYANKLRRGGNKFPSAVEFYEDFLLANYSANLKAYFALAYDDLDSGASGNHAFTRSGVTFTGPTPLGFRKRQCTRFDGSASQIRLENTTYPFGMSRWTIACWFKKTGAGAVTSTSGGADGFPSTDPVLPLVSKGRGEAEGSSVDMNWFLGINKVANGTTYKIAGDFETNPGGPNNRILGTTLIADNQWYFAVFTFDGAAMKLYLNGALEATMNTANVPRSDSVQKAGIGTAYTSTGVAGGFFQGNIAGVAIWSEALALADIQALYNKGIANTRTERTIVHDAPDNQIVHGTNFANWALDSGSTKDASGITLTSDGSDGDYAEVLIFGLQPETDYWCRIDIAAKSAGATGQLQVAALSDGRLPNIAATNGSAVSLGNALVGTEPKYFKVRTDLSAGPHLLVVKHVGSPAGETIKFSDLRLFTAPARSAAKIVHLGDRTGGFDLNRANTVSEAILHPNADALNVIATGDLADTTNTYATCNDRLKLGPAGNNGIIARGGKIYPSPGNHDYDGARETEYDDYFDTNGYNGGKFYYSQKLGHCEFFMWSAFTDEADGGAYTGTPQAAQISTQGKYMLRRICESDADWKIFLHHYASYSSSAAYGSWTYGRWNWHGLGIPVVLQAHVHGVERLEEQVTVEGQSRSTCFYTVARGGGDHHGWGAKRTGPTDFTRFRIEDAAVSGYLKVYDSPDTLVLEYYDTNHNLRDRIKFTQA